MIKAGIIGGAGYTAGELIRILISHPEVEIYSVMSGSHVGKPISEAHPDLLGEIELTFTDSISKQCDVVFLCSGHGKSAEILKSLNLSDHTKIVDLSSDFRIESKHHDFVYGLVEMNRNRIKFAQKVANPGCFATAIQLALLPVAFHQKLNSNIHVSAITGSTGAGQSLSETTHFSWRSNNASIYKPFQHQHLGEIKQSLNLLQNGFQKAVNFIPMRGAFTRGILAAVYFDMEDSENEIQEMYSNYYEEHPFVHISDGEVDVKQVINTNKCILKVQKIENQVLITSVIDNLIKGASGQAVQNMNIMFGLNEMTGLKLKASAF